MIANGGCSGFFLLPLFCNGLKSWVICISELHHSRESFCQWKGIGVTVLTYRAQVNNSFFWWLSPLMPWMWYHVALFFLSAISCCSTRWQHGCHSSRCLSPCPALASCSSGFRSALAVGLLFCLVPGSNLSLVSAACPSHSGMTGLPEVRLGFWSVFVQLLALQAPDP